MARPPQSPAQIKARKGEIARRYARKPSGLPLRAFKPPTAVIRAQVVVLLRHRNGGRDAQIPYDAAGRAGLIILLELGLDGRAAERLAPWCGEELDQLRKEAGENCEAKLTLAQRLALTSLEYENLELWNLGKPRDMTWAAFKAFRGERRRKSDRESKRKRRAEQAAATAIDNPIDTKQQQDERIEAVRIFGLAEHMRTLRQIQDLVRHLAAFRGLNDEALRKAARRCVVKLESLGLAEIKIDPGPRGLSVLSARRSDDKDQHAAE